MTYNAKRSRLGGLVPVLVALAVVAGCAAHSPGIERSTRRDKTKKSIAIGAAAGAVLGAVLGEGEADEILAGAAIGAGIGAGIGTYMDKQEEALGHIPGTSVKRVAENMLLIKFDSDILFQVDSAMLSGASRVTLNDVAAVLMEYPKTAVIINGHTDATGSEVHNQALSERRATAVMSQLVGQGLDPSRMTALGYGESQPVAANDMVAGRALNRRVNILLKAKAR
jgi:outer membrane protein OmpA-like peptidoglycan-associated protein